MKKFKTILMLTAIISLTAIGCKKGDTGPIGPVGTNGVDGINGANGANGANGNANVKSETFTVYPSEWLTLGNKLYTNHYAPLITSNIASSGGVMLYMQSSSSTRWQALPFTWPSGSSSIIYRFWHDVNNLLIQFIGETSTPSQTSNLNFKMVVFSSSARIANPNVNYNDYNAVKKAFHLK